MKRFSDRRDNLKIMDMLLLARRIKECRETLNISAEELGAYIGVNKTTVYRYENGEFKSIKLSRLEKIAEFLNTSIDYLTGKSDDRFTDESMVSLSKKDNKEISDILNMTSELLKQEGLMFDGNPADDEAIQSIIDSMQIGLELAKKKNKDKYTPKKYKR